MADQTLSDLLKLSARTSTFVSIDVLGSTMLKKDEVEQDIVYTFLAYHKQVTDLAYVHHGEVIHISGDGVMCRFQKPADAVDMTEALLNALPGFNKSQNRLHGEFRLRTGVHTGEVLENESGSAGRWISQTLDIAAKLQQSAAANSAYISEATATQIPQSEKRLRRLGWNAALQVNVYELRHHAAQAQARRELPRPARVLVIDGDPEDQAVLRKALFGHQYILFNIFNQDQSATPVAAWKPHAIVMSLDLPWDSGWELLRSLRANAGLSGIPVIAASRETTSDPIQRSFRLGANGYIRKPFDGAQVIKRMDVVMREFYL